MVKSATKKPENRQGLPKFDSPFWLALGIVVSLILFGDSLWALIADWHAAWIPFQVSKILAMGFGIALAVHSVDMIMYYRKHGRLGTDQSK